MSNNDFDAVKAVTRANITILKDRRTYAMGATILLGESAVRDGIATAATDGRNKFYGKDFMSTLTPKQHNYIVLHENGHVIKMDMQRHPDLIAEDAHMFNVAADYVVNGIIEGLGISDIIERPPGALVDPKFNGWSIRDVYRFLKTGRDKDGNEQGEPEPQFDDSDDDGDDGDDGSGGGDPSDDGDDGDSPSPANTDQGKPDPSSVKIGSKTYSTQPIDEHDTAAAQGMSEQESKQLEREIKQVIEQAVMLAGVQGGEVPLAIREALAPDVDWERELEDYLNTSQRGEDDLNVRRYDRRYLADDHYVPTTHSERVGTVLLCMDSSGSTCGSVFDKFVAGFSDILQRVRPERVRILHWDTSVKHDEVITEADYLGADLKDILNPRGGGGTCVSRVSDYIIKNNIEADCCLVFTDGYVENDPRWHVRIPTLWMVTDRPNFQPPAGRMVNIK